MRIIQICTNFRPGGIQRHVLDLTNDLSERGHQVALAGDHGDWCPDDSDPNFEHLSLDKIAAGQDGVFKRLSEILPVARKLRQALKKHNIQLVHSHETAPAIVARLATMGLNIPVIFTYHGSEPEREASVARTAKRCADMTISPSRTSLESLISKGLTREKTHVIGLGVHKLPKVSKEHVAELRKSLLGKKGRFLISSLSRLDQQKGIDMMIEVARKISDKRDDVVFAIGGHGPLSDIVESWAEVTGVSENVKFLGPVDDVASVLMASDLYLLTSRWEALPISIVEAFQTGLPVIATDCGGVKELVDPSVGCVLQVGDTRAIAVAVLEMIDNTTKREKMGLAAKKLSREARFSPQAVHESFEKLYREMIETSLS